MKLIFWDVDTQYDFMMPDGKLYVPGAESLIPNLTRLTAFARSNGIRICGSVDYHVMGDTEISNDPDFHETFPPHCLQGTAGQEKIGATKPKNPLWIDGNRYDPGLLKRLLENHRGEIILRKQKFDVFSNPNISDVLDFLRPTEIVIYGVALDVCDAHAIEGFLRLNKYNLYLVTDAVRAIYEDKGRELIESWTQRGVKLISTSVVERGTLLAKNEKG
ncbi:MAG: cysteine hydrolase [Bacteroidetes bacterium]|nr:cysteine hydrolase [Bacteroidota bacterium]